MSHIRVQLTLADCPVTSVSGLQPWDPEFHSIGGMAKKRKIVWTWQDRDTDGKETRLRGEMGVMNYAHIKSNWGRGHSD